MDDGDVNFRSRFSCMARYEENIVCVSPPRAAEVTLNEVWPINKTTRELIKSPEQLAEMNYKSKLEAASRKQGAQFKEYRPETGSWVFRVSTSSICLYDFHL